VPTTLAEADALASVVDAIAASFPPYSGSRHKPLHGDEEAAQEERLLLPRAVASDRRRADAPADRKGPS
jgi:hypothetical protein